MNRQELTEILVMSAGLSKTTLGEGDVLLWWELPDIRDLNADRAKEGVRAYYQQNDKPMKPVHLIQYAKMVANPRRQTAHYGEPGEILCAKCHLVHYPHESCDVLVPMPGWFRQRVAEARGSSKGMFAMPKDVMRPPFTDGADDDAGF